MTATDRGNSINLVFKIHLMLIHASYTLHRARETGYGPRVPRTLSPYPSYMIYEPIITQAGHVSPSYKLGLSSYQCPPAKRCAIQCRTVGSHKHDDSGLMRIRWLGAHANTMAPGSCGDNGSGLMRKQWPGGGELGTGRRARHRASSSAPRAALFSHEGWMNSLSVVVGI